MKKQLFNLLGLIMVMSLITISCSKDDEDTTPTLSKSELLLIQDDIAADNIYNDIDATVQEHLVELEAADYGAFNLKSTEEELPCLVITVDYPDSTRFPKVITFDYGTGCEVIIHGDTITKEGIMEITITDHFFTPGAQRIVTFEDFYVNSMKVEGILTNTFLGRNDGTDYLEFEYTVEDGKLIFADAEGNPLEYTRDAEYLKEWDRELRPLEDTMYLSGSAWGINARGENYSREIQDKLTLVHCLGYGRRWVIIDGVVISTVGDEVTTTDYTGGGCEGTVEIYRNGPFQNGSMQMQRIRWNHRYRHQGKH